MNLLYKSDFECYLRDFTKMRIGNKVINCPYWSNKIKNGKVIARGFLDGKGEADEIKKYLNKVYDSELKKGIIRDSKEDLIKLAKRERIGIDCSGLVYRLLSFLKKGGYYVQNSDLGVEYFFPEGINRTNANTLTGNNYCIQIKKAENLLPGDLIRMMGGTHLLFVLSIENNEITYVHSSGKSEVTGVHTGKIIINNNKLSWLEKTKLNENFGEKYFHPKEGDGFFRPFSKKPETFFIEDLMTKNIHVVGVTGSEGSSIFRFLIKNGAKKITAHDYIDKNELEKSYKLWHKGMENDERKKRFEQFKADLNKVKFYCSENYLDNLEQAEIIFAPQSWRMYKANQPIKKADEKGVPIYSMTRLYLELAKATTIGVTGTVGKGSTANIIYQILKRQGKNVYFAGNETWNNQILENITELAPADYLILEISHRQLLDGVSKAPHIVVVTNIYPNHLNEVSWKDYVNLKILLPTLQKENDYAVINYDSKDLREAITQIKSKIIFYSLNERKMNNDIIQPFYEALMSINSAQYNENILAASTVLLQLGLKITEIKEAISKLQLLPARRELLGNIKGINIFDDIKSTTPWAVTAALLKTTKPVVLICGGDTKGIDYQASIKEWYRITNKIIVLKSKLGEMIKDILPKGRFIETNNLEEALKLAVKESGKDTEVVISPGAAYFYTNFIKGKKSLRKIFTSLLQEGLKSED